MSTGRSLGLWSAAAILLIATAVLYFVNPSGNRGREPQQRRDELESAVARAATYYEFGHYNRAAETYRIAINRGLQDGVELYRYAYSREIAEELDLDAYLNAYRQLLAQSPEHDYVADIESLLAGHALLFEYEEAREDRIPKDELVRLNGTVARIRRGRIEAGEDTLFVATKPDDWLGHVGSEVRVIAPRVQRYRPGDSLVIIGRYEGWCSEDDGGGISRAYPCVTASGIRVDGDR